MNIRTEKAKKFYVLADGVQARSPTATTVAQMFKFAGGGEHKIALSDFSQSVLSCAAWHGLSQKLGDCYANAKTAAEAEDSFQDQLAALSGDNGTWLSERETAGPRVSLLAEALCRVKSDKYATIEAAAAEIATWTPEIRKQKVAIPALSKMVDRLRAERLLAASDAKADAGADTL